MAARNCVSLDVVLRRYLAGYCMLTEFVFEAADDAELPAGVLQPLLTGQAVVFDRLLEAVSEEHGREVSRLPRSTSERRGQARPPAARRRGDRRERAGLPT